jgi:hypothetical protein
MQEGKVIKYAAIKVDSKPTLMFHMHNKTTNPAPEIALSPPDRFQRHHFPSNRQTAPRVKTPGSSDPSSETLGERTNQKAAGKNSPSSFLNSWS